MIDFKTFRLLNETLGFHALGLKAPQNMGFATEGGVPPFLGGGADAGAGAGSPGPDMGADAVPGGMGDDSPDMGGDDDQGAGDKDPQDMSHEELVAALVELGHEESELDGMEDDDLRDMLMQEKDNDDASAGDDADADADHDDDGGMGDSGGDDSSMMLPSHKPAGPFMKKEGFEAKKDKGDKKDKKDKKEDKGEKKSFGNFSKGKDGDKKSEGGDKPTFMMKKKCGSGDMGVDKKVVLGKCKGCSEKIKKEGAVPGPVKDYDDSEEAFFKSVRQQLSQQDVNRRFDDGMGFKTEDLLLPPNPLDVVPDINNNPQAGDVGFAPSNRIGGDFTAESVKDILRRMDNLNK